MLNKTLPLPAAADPLVGTLVGGRYQILAKLGHGGMGAVYEAVQDSIERRVAIKVLLPSVAQDAEISKRFVNEARAVNRVNHPGLVQVSDFGQLDSGAPYIVMEFLKGETLRQRMSRFGGGLPTTEVVELGSQIAESLTAAHGLGIIHRAPCSQSRSWVQAFQRPPAAKDSRWKPDARASHPGWSRKAGLGRRGESGGRGGAARPGLRPLGARLD
jgi:hypothetical protein